MTVCEVSRIGVVSRAPSSRGRPRLGRLSSAVGADTTAWVERQRCATVSALCAGSFCAQNAASVKTAGPVPVSVALPGRGSAFRCLDEALGHGVHASLVGIVLMIIAEE